MNIFCDEVHETIITDKKPGENSPTIEHNLFISKAGQSSNTCQLNNK